MPATGWRAFSQLRATFHVKGCRAVVGTYLQAAIERFRGLSKITFSIRRAGALKVRRTPKLCAASFRRVEIQQLMDHDRRGAPDDKDTVQLAHRIAAGFGKP